MSLGATAGFRNPEDPEQVAIKNATDDGVICVVSAGNSTTSNHSYIIEGMSDTATIGSPGIAIDALQVASSENSQIVLSALTATIEGVEQDFGYTECDVSPLDVFSSDKELSLVDCGLGEVSDFEGKDLSGKVALIKRGAIAFVDKQLIKNLNFKLPAGGIVWIIGHNGAGKTTLFKMITGVEKPDSGTLTIGDTVKMGYVDQSRDSLDDNKNVWEEISGGNDILTLGKIEKPSRAYVASFNFKGQDQQKKVGTLSGGERNRVHLAKMLQQGANLLLLDEPTNDLDTETLAALEEALESFAGCAVVISHDRWFLDRLATHILAFEGNGHVEWFEGNFEDYERDKERRGKTAA